MKKGFTLLELLVVIAIIGILASVLMVSLSSARAKTKNSTFIQGIEQFNILMALEYSTYGTYSGLNSGGWVTGDTSPTTCDTIYGPSSGLTSTNKAKANDLCQQIVSASSTDDRYAFSVDGSSTKYSVHGWFNGLNGLLYCMGSSGKTMGAVWGSGPNGEYSQNIGCGNGNQ